MTPVDKSILIFAQSVILALILTPVRAYLSGLTGWNWLYRGK